MLANKKKLELALATACMNPMELCKVAGIRYQTYRRITDGKEAKPATIGRIARALNVPVTDIIGNTAATADNVDK